MATPRINFEPFLPVVKVKKVTLEIQPDASYDAYLSNINTAEAFYDKNPHIDTGDVPIHVRSHIAGALSPKTRVVLDLAISVPVGSTSLNSSTVRNSIDINVITTSSEIYKKILKNPITLADQSLSSIIKTVSLSSLISSMDLSTIQETLADGTRVMTYSFRFDDVSLIDGQLNDLGIIAYSSISRPSRALGGMGTTIINKAVSQKSGLLVVENGKIVSTSQIYRERDGRVWNGPVHYGKVDRIDIAKKITILKELDLSAPSNRLIKNKMRERKIKNLEDILVFFSTEDKKDLWMTGHEMEPKYVPSTYKVSDISKWGIHKVIVPEIISLPRVQDFRTFNEIENIEFDFAHIENAALGAIKNNLRNSKIDINTQDTYFSDLFLTRDIMDQARFFFTIDWQRMLLDNSVFGKIFEKRSSVALDNLLNKSKITSFRIFRHRIQGSSEAGASPIVVPNPEYTMPAYLRQKPFSENQIDEMLFETKDSLTTTGIIPVSKSLTNDNVISEISNTSLGLTISNSNLPNNYTLRHFEGIDGSIKDITDGYYQYRIEFEMLDKSVSVLDDIRSQLDINLKGIRKYYNEATKVMRTIQGIPAQDGSPYLGGTIAGRTEQIYQRGEVQTGNFNSKTNFFTSEFSEVYAPGGQLMNSSPPQSPVGGVALASAISNNSHGLVSIIKLLASDHSYKNLNWTNIETTLLNYLNPWSATPSSINAVMLLMESISNNLESIIGTIRSRERQETRNEDGEIISIGFDEKQNPASKDRSYKIKNTPQAIFNANLMTNLGFDFLNTTTAEQNEGGLNTISYTDYSTYAKQQYTNLFPSYNSSFQIVPLGGFQTRNIPGDNIKMGNTEGIFFSPYRIVMPGGSVSLQDSNYESSEFLKPVSYSLLKSRTNNNFLETLVEGDATSPFVNDKVLANDLSNYFSTYHSAEVVTPDIGGEGGFLLDLQSQYRSGRTIPPASFADSYYKGLRKLSNQRRYISYEFYLDVLKESTSPDLNPRLLTKNMSLDKSSFDLSDQNSSASLLISQAVAARNPPNDAAERSYESSYLRDVPPQTKTLLYYNVLADSATSRLSQAARDFFAKIENNVILYPEFMYRTQTINKMEHLAGYNVGVIMNPNNPRVTGPWLSVPQTTPPPPIFRVLLKQPNWRSSLVRGSFKPKFLGASYAPLCRSTAYVNNMVLLSRNSNYDLPTYDEYYRVVIPPLANIAPIGTLDTSRDSIGGGL